MITDVTLVYKDAQSIKKLGDALEASPFFTFLKEKTKDAYALKNYWGAKQTPFAVCYNGEKVIKVFYSETGEDVIESLINYLHDIPFI